MNNLELPRGFDESFNHKNNLSLLTNREKEIYNLFFTGITSKEISKKLGIGYKTVKAYSTIIYQKLNVNGRRDLVGKFLENEKKK